MKYIALLVIVLTGLGGCTEPNKKVVVATAANVQYVMQELKEEFEKESDTEVEMVVSSSGKLTAQIREGAPFDVFVSADTQYPNEIHKNGGSDVAPRVYARGTLVLWTLDSTAIDLSINRLADKSIRKVALANPRTAPYGEAAVQAMEKAGIYEQVKDKLVYGESIAQTSQYIASGAADAGFTAMSVVLSPEMKGKGHWVKVDSSAYQPIEQAAVLLRHSEDSFKAQPSRDFFEFLFSGKAKAIFRKYGYSVE
ncbi:molybdate ABC transporter substrate-binding protein [Telluribacter humicola]|uniref:molybdate ABC transporter substrate-binding protein n=1 Tax=Telluribacter humicola TaxID=1720261 RepID=UPI001A97443A|nr:molybdate ABC transporter substrate-binding protein [Telluribacter humicola]